MQALLTNIVSTLMLPLFLIMILCLMAGARPEPVVKGFIDLGIALVTGSFKLAFAITKGIIELLSDSKHKNKEASTTKSKGHQTTQPKARDA